MNNNHSKKNSRRNTDHSKLNDQELLNLIKAEFYRIQPKGCWDFFKQSKNIPCLPTLQKRFNKTYNEILILAGIPDEELNFVRRDKKIYLQQLKMVADKLGHPPSAKEFNKQGYCSATLRKLFGSYNNALRSAGLEINMTRKKITYNKSELKKQYLNLSKKLGNPASCNDLDNAKDLPNSSSFPLRFGGMKGLKETAGMAPSTHGPKPKYSKELIIKMLMDECNKLGRCLTVAEINSNPSLPTHVTILKYFKTTSIVDVWKEVLDKSLDQNTIRNNNKSTAKSINQSNIQMIQAGKKGESIVSHELDFLDKDKYIVYNDINLLSNGRTQQIDHLVIGPNGIFHIETKNWSGEINIDRLGIWSQVKGSVYRQKENPTGQVLRHEEIIYEILDKKYSINSLIVFSNKKTRISGKHNNPIPIIKSDILLHYIKSHVSKIHLSIKDIEEIKKLIESSIISRTEDGSSLVS